MIACIFRLTIDIVIKASNKYFMPIRSEVVRLLKTSKSLSRKILTISQLAGIRYNNLGEEIDPEKVTADCLSRFISASPWTS